jgi:hypothetical protein
VKKSAVLNTMRSYKNCSMKCFILLTILLLSSRLLLSEMQPIHGIVAHIAERQLELIDEDVYPADTNYQQYLRKLIEGDLHITESLTEGASAFTKSFHYCLNKILAEDGEEYNQEQCIPCGSFLGIRPEDGDLLTAFWYTDSVEYISCSLSELKLDNSPETLNQVISIDQSMEELVYGRQGSRFYDEHIVRLLLDVVLKYSDRLSNINELVQADPLMGEKYQSSESDDRHAAIVNQSLRRLSDPKRYFGHVHVTSPELFKGLKESLLYSAVEGFSSSVKDAPMGAEMLEGMQVFSRHQMLEEYFEVLKIVFPSVYGDWQLSDGERLVNKQAMGRADLIKQYDALLDAISEL